MKKGTRTDAFALMQAIWEFDVGGLRGEIADSQRFMEALGWTRPDKSLDEWVAGFIERCQNELADRKTRPTTTGSAT